MILFSINGNDVTTWSLPGYYTLSRDIVESLQYVNNAAELWQELEDKYDQTNGAKLYQLQKELSDLSQGSMDITPYYTKMKRLWEELGTLDNNNQCNCLLNLLGSFHSGSPCAGTNNISNGAANFAGPFIEEASGDW
ncbi:hypothetical protein KY290_027736 [Solanum tuberosum]|uniref:Retrotransposon gag domain-containing protein n=1 Tax=Solanum tuberosum TaxID=4113 RepID=A0ABQ7UGD7_SOLTU|nr:hypothetical protein KY285_026710 [Solanum tuberosum]KAH0748504.1 hypothetical protein KY290_027736 [Solanum tuberosum]